MKPPPEITLIAAVARNGAIGRGNALLFNEPADQRHFRQATMGCPVIMGRKTWDSLPPRFRPLPGRRNIVLSRDRALQAEGAQCAASLDEALALAGDAPRVFVIGGAQLYALALPRARTLMLTEIDADLEGDSFFPAWPRSRFNEVSRESHLTEGGIRYHFVTYERA
ncbi:MAG: dihydrofolate reductase [Rubrivivax sp.]|nr:dihydrofolate reductase [Rubrivivax sp.]